MPALKIVSKEVTPISGASPDNMFVVHPINLSSLEQKRLEEKDITSRCEGRGHCAIKRSEEISLLRGIHGI